MAVTKETCLSEVTFWQQYRHGNKGTSRQHFPILSRFIFLFIPTLLKSDLTFFEKEKKCWQKFRYRQITVYFKLTCNFFTALSALNWRLKQFFIKHFINTWSSFVSYPLMDGNFISFLVVLTIFLVLWTVSLHDHVIISSDRKTFDWKFLTAVSSFKINTNFLHCQWFVIVSLGMLVHSESFACLHLFLLFLLLASA